jgi:hypothetical protein
MGHGEDTADDNQQCDNEDETAHLLLLTLRTVETRSFVLPEESVTSITFREKGMPTEAFCG